MQALFPHLQRLVPQKFPDSHEVWALPDHGRIQFFTDIIPLKSGLTAEVRLGYRRYLEFDKPNASGQDAAGLRFDEAYIVAVVADGVSQSFFGDLAATHVSKWLLSELWKNREAPPNLLDLERGLKEQEKELAHGVETYPLNDIDLPLLKTALEGMRKLGSQTVFSGLIWDLSNQSVVLYQVGNVSGTFYFRDKGPQLVKGGNGRWSSAQKSALHLSRITVQNCVGILVSSDGVSSTCGERGREGLTEASFSEAANAMAANDDVSFVSVFITRNGDDEAILLPPQVVEPSCETFDDSRTPSPPKSRPVDLIESRSQQSTNFSQLENRLDTQRGNRVSNEAWRLHNDQVRTSKPCPGASTTPRQDRIQLKRNRKVLFLGSLLTMFVAGFLTFVYFWMAHRIAPTRSKTNVSHPVSSQAASIVAGTENKGSSPVPSSGNSNLNESNEEQTHRPASEEANSDARVTNEPSKTDTASAVDVKIVARNTKDFASRYPRLFTPHLRKLLESTKGGILVRVSVPGEFAAAVDLVDASNVIASYPLDSGEIVFFDGNPSFFSQKQPALYLAFYNMNGDQVLKLPLRLDAKKRCYDAESRSKGTK